MVTCNSVFERIDYISLGNIPLSVATRSSLSSQGVPISVITTAVIKVRNEKNSILTAIEQFTGRNEKEIIDNIQGYSNSKFLKVSFERLLQL